MTSTVGQAPPPRVRGHSRVLARFSAATSLDRSRIVLVVAALASANVVALLFAQGVWAQLLIPLVAVGVFFLARVSGLHWHELGVHPRHLWAGLRWGGGIALAVAAVIAALVAIPATRGFFVDHRYASLSAVIFAAVVLIPLLTVVPEELAFRGVLHGSLRRRLGKRGGLIVGSALFGLWHVLSSLGLNAQNAGLSAVLGGGWLGQLLGILGAVLATSVAGAGFIWLRERTGSILAPVGLHWALNAGGALAVGVVMLTR